MSQQFELIKDPKSGYVYCCKIGQSLADRISEKHLQPKSPFIEAKEAENVQPQAPPKCDEIIARALNSAYQVNGQD